MTMADDEKDQLSFASLTAPRASFARDIEIDGIEHSRGSEITFVQQEDTTTNTISERGIDEPPVLKVEHHAPILDHSRRMRMRSSRSFGRDSLRDLRKAMGRQASVMSIYSPLEARRVDGGLPPRSLTCVVMNLISAGYILLPYGTLCVFVRTLLLIDSQQCQRTLSSSQQPLLKLE